MEDNVHSIILIIERIKKYLLKKYKAYIYYIGSNEALPPPLNQSEEEAIMAELEAGNVHVRQTLIERNLRLVVYIARKFENTGINVEDLISIGTIGLIKAVNTFDVKKEIKLATYASRCIENEILMFLRKHGKIKFEVSLDEPLNTDWDGNELLLSDVLGTEEDVVCKKIEQEVDRQILYDIIKKLNYRDQNILLMRYGLRNGNEKTQKEVADLLGISQSYISRLEKKIIRDLQKEFMKLV